jgi:lipopolysaccharide export system permease protein
VFGSILHRMILWELVKVFLMSLVGITGILLMAGIVAEASQQGLGPAQILAAIPLLIPSTLPYTIPATTLFATCVVYGRLAHDNEILAIKAAGVNILKVVTPGLLLGLVMSAVTMGLYYRIIPYTHHLLRTMAFNDAEELLYSLLRRTHEINHPQLRFSMWVQEVQGRRLRNVELARHSEHNPTEDDLVAFAPEADLRVHMAKRLLLVHMRNAVGISGNGSGGYIGDQTYEVPLPDDLDKKKNDRRPRDMTWQEILDRRQEMQAKIDELTSEVRLGTSQMVPQDETDLPQEYKDLLSRAQFFQLQVTVLDVELQMRPALSVGCLCFILVGCPVGIWFSRSDYLSSFITCFLPIVFLYYPLMLCGIGMAKEGRLHLVPLVWGADALVGVVGLVLFWRLLKN